MKQDYEKIKIIMHTVGQSLDTILATEQIVLAPAVPWILCLHFNLDRMFT